MRVLGESCEEDMVTCFLQGELSSERFGAAIREQLAAMNQPEELLTEPDPTDRGANKARRDVLAATRGYGQDRDVFQHFPTSVHWVRALLTPGELARVRYIEYSYWNEISDGTRLPADAAQRIKAGTRAFDVSNERFLAAASAVERGEAFPPLILAGEHCDALVCLEGNLRLTGYALAGFPGEVECLVGTAATMSRWAE